MSVTEGVHDDGFALSVARDGTSQTRVSSLVSRALLAFSQGDGNEVCTQCPSGWFNLEYRTRNDVTMSKGKYLDETGRVNEEACKLCPKGQYTNFTGASECVRCPRGNSTMVTESVQF